MSDIIKGDTPVAKLIDGYEADDRGSALGAPYWMEAALSEIKTFMSMNIDIDGVPTPRYGVLSLLLQSTPCFIYAHEEFKKNFGTTAFTDGVHIFICEDLLLKMINEEDASKGMEEGVIPLLQHELTHKLLNHHDRLRSYPRDIANRAADLSINARLQLGYPEITWVPSLRETGVGFKPGEKEKYAVLDEETIARDLYEDRLRRQREQEQSGNKGNKGKPGQGNPGQSGGQGGQGSQGNQSGQGQSSQGKSGQGKGGQPGQGGQGKSGQGKPGPGQGEGGDGQGDQSGQFGAEGDEHMPELEDVVRVMKENGMDAALAKLGVNDATNPEEIGRIKTDNELNKIEAINKAAAQMAQAGGKYPGSHIAAAASDMIIARSKGKLHWKMALRELLLGDGGKYRASMEETSSLYYMDEAEEMLGTRPWLPTELSFKPQEVVMVIVDTSGSVQIPDLKAFASEIIELKTAGSGFGDAAAEVIVLPADTVIRGEPIQITDANVDEFCSTGFKMAGRGGTDFRDVIKQATALPMVKNKKIRSWVYFTDLYAEPPASKKEAGLSEDSSFVFVSAPSTDTSYTVEFAKKVEGWARVTEIREGVEVDLSETSMDMAVNPTRRAAKI